MKKLKRFLTLLVSGIMLCALLLLGGCGEGEVYKFKKLVIEEEDTEYVFTVGQKYEGVVLKEDSFVIMLQDETVIIRMLDEEVDDDGKVIEEEVEVMVGKWYKGINDEVYFSSEEGDCIVAKKDGKTITIDFYGVVITLEK